MLIIAAIVTTNSIAFWLISLLVTTLLGIIAWFIKRNTAHNDIIETNLVVSINELKDVIAGLKLSVSNINTGCAERHKGLDKQLELFHESIQDNSNRITTIENKK